MKRKFVDFKVLTASLCCAVVMGAISFVFLKMLGLSSVFREFFPYCIWFLPLSGMLTAFVYKKYGGESSKGNNLIIQSANEGVKVPKRLAVLTFFFTLLTHFSGGSQGQRKSFVIALKLAQYHYLAQRKGTAPTLLLDDVFDKLDAKRGDNLIGMMASGGFGQIFISDTNMGRLQNVSPRCSSGPRTSRPCPPSRSLWRSSPWVP